MSAQFGQCNFDGKPVDRDEIEKVRTALSPYGPDGEGSILEDNLVILYRAFHTTKESRSEQQPYRSASGVVITWDGRLDNRADLVRDLSGEVSIESTDVQVVGALFEKQGVDSFSRLSGDWALSIFNPSDRSIVLAKDCVGARHLYYSVQGDLARWSTVLEVLVHLAPPQALNLEEEYLAGWLSLVPGPHLTPYTGIHAVPPSSFVRLTVGACSVRKFWDLDPARQIRYRSDTEYEEHFQAVFAESVRRRLRSDCPVLAELSGGMDSSSIVCMADLLIDQGKVDAPRVDTISYYDDTEPNWNERPYFTKVEEKRKRKGWHIDVSPEASGKNVWDDSRFVPTPGMGSYSGAAIAHFISCLTSQNNRVVLSGTGGDEFTGGVPSPTPELSDLLTTRQLRTLVHQLKVWALGKRKPWLHLLSDIAKGFVPSNVLSKPYDQLSSWLYPSFVRRQRRALSGYRARLRVFGGLPSFQYSLSTLNVLRRQLACSPNLQTPVHERSYPFLDRDLLEFLCAIPCEQLVRPGQRRSLMRRSLTGLVPDEILHRKRKAFLVRSPTRETVAEWRDMTSQDARMIADSLGIVKADRFAESMHQAHSGGAINVVLAQRVVSLEQWLRHLARQNVFRSVRPTALPEHTRGR